MRQRTFILFAIAAIASGVGIWGTPAAHAQGKTYPSYFGSTPSAAYYNLPNPYDRDTYMNPNPFPAYRPRMYEERGYSGSAYPPSVYAPSPPPSGFYTYSAARPTLGYYYGPGPFVYSNYGRSGRMAFRYGWW